MSQVSNLYKKLFSVMLLTVFVVLPAFGNTDEPVYTRTIAADFADIRVDIESAILNRGLVIDFHAKIGEMLNRTAADVGSNQTVFVDADSWQFCSAVLSRKMMEADPTNIAYCPYVVFAYATEQDPENIVVGFRRTDSAMANSSMLLNEVNELLQGIVDEVTE